MPIYEGQPSLARQLGSSLNEGLGRLAQMKMTEMENQNQLARQLAANKQKAGLMQQMQQSKFAQQLAAKQQDAQAAQQWAISQGMTPEQAAIFAQSPQHLQSLVAKDVIAAPAERELADYLRASRGMPRINANQAANEIQQAQTPEANIEAPRQDGQAPQIPSRVNQRGLSAIQGEENLALKKKAQEFKEGAPEREIEAAQKKEVIKTNSEIYKNIINSAKAVQDDLDTSRRVIDLLQTDDITSGKVYQALDRFGLGEWWRTGNDQLLDKEVAKQLTGAANAFNTSRLTNFEVKSYGQTFANRKNTPEVGIALAAAKQRVAAAEKLKEKTARDIKKSNNNVLPLDFDDQLEAKIQPELKRFADETDFIYQNLDKIVVSPKKLELPPASSFAGQGIQDAKTKKFYKSMGDFWVEVSPAQAKAFLERQQ